VTSIVTPSGWCPDLPERRPDRGQLKGKFMQPIDQLSYIVPTLIALVDRIETDQLISRTPCAQFAVHDVLDHMIVLGGSFAYGFRGEEVPEIKAPPVYGRVPAAEFRTAMEGLLEAVKSPGATERTISAPIGDVPGDVFARFVAFDGLIHGWDLATATGLDFELQGCVIDAVDQFARAALGPELRDGDTFKDETVAPETASQLDRLAAFSGRSL
jgi:uncharacterized protein (TIGR03086 family)